jgi:hypothetical protein
VLRKFKFDAIALVKSSAQDWRIHCDEESFVSGSYSTELSVSLLEETEAAASFCHNYNRVDKND